jgi:hypothetical protein
MLEVAGIRIEFGQPIDLPTPTDLTPGERSSLEHAQQRVDFPILYPGAVGPPGAVHLVDGELGVQVFLSWEASDRLPEVGDSGIGLLIAQFRASLDEDFIKILFEGTQVDEVRVDGHRAFWLSGAPHVFMFERTSPPGPVADGTRLTGNVLIWEADGVTYRIESGLDLDTTLAIASSLVPAQPG